MLFECCANFLTCDKREPHPERPRIGLLTNFQRSAFWQGAFILQNFVRSVIIKSTTDEHERLYRKKAGQMYFQYGEAETAYLSARDERMAAVIAQVGHIEREVDADLFSAVVHHIVGQQISTKAQATIWKRMRDEFGVVDAAAVLGAGVEKLQSFGMTFRKAEYITDFARKIESGEFDLEGIRQRPDDEAIRELSGLKGVGVWTAEMILLFCMQRPDVFSYDDLAIQRGLRMVYHHRKIDRKLFEKYRRRFSPYCSVASLYLWAAAGGAVPGLKDYAPTQKPKRKG